MKKFITIIILIIISCNIHSQDPTDKFHYLEGVSMLDLGDFKGAVSKFNMFIDNNPYYVSAYISRGTAKAQLADYKSAFVDFSTAINLEPTSPDGYFFRAVVRNRMGEYNEAIDDLKMAIKYDFTPIESVNKLMDIVNSKLEKIIVDELHKGNIKVSKNIEYTTNGVKWDEKDKVLEYESNVLVFCDENDFENCKKNSSVDYKFYFTLHWGNIESDVMLINRIEKYKIEYIVTSFEKVKEGYDIEVIPRYSDKKASFVIDTVRNIISFQEAGNPIIKIFKINK